MSIRLYVGNLPKEVEKEELEAVFSEFDDSASTKLVTDRKTGKCRGFAFVTVKNDEQADQIIEKFNGFSFKENTLKIEKALPRSKGKGDDAGSDGVRRSSKKSSKRSEADAAQPDPRWASALAELKDRLAAQATNP